MEHQTENNTILNTILIFITTICTALEKSSAEQIYTWIFRCLSLVSLMLIIVINWKKAMQILFPNDKKYAI